ncbi:MAG: hypothetical protein FJ147_25625 [Deltaproteobacteria bacterium]|nr:hypothetical protein [Deltaproteobacteria bacterium]
MQDIAGCRLIVPDIANQEVVVQSLQKAFERTTIVDRRQKPSHGYRAVHVIVRCLDKMVEIQVRTLLQHLWAELSERSSDVLDPGLKYGGGDDRIQRVLMHISKMVAEEEVVGLANVPLQGSDEETKAQFVVSDEEVSQGKQKTLEILHQALDIISKYQ